MEFKTVIMSSEGMSEDQEDYEGWRSAMLTFGMLNNEVENACKLLADYLECESNRPPFFSTRLKKGKHIIIDSNQLVIRSIFTTQKKENHDNLFDQISEKIKTYKFEKIPDTYTFKATPI